MVLHHQLNIQHVFAILPKKEEEEEISHGWGEEKEGLTKINSWRI